MKKLLIVFLILIIIAAIAGWYTVYGNKAYFTQKETFIVINEGKTSAEEVVKILSDNQAIGSTFFFKLLANQMHIWEKIKPGKYKIVQGQNALTTARMLRNNKQAETKLVINKVRTPQDLAKLIGKNFSIDSSTALKQIHEVFEQKKYGIDSSNFLFYIVPNTYSFYWNTSVEKILETLKNESEEFWQQSNRQQQAQNSGLTPLQVCIIASIVEEETNKQDEKGNVASVYINRLNKGMPLGADPTIKFALQDFSLRRILFAHLSVASPYNTYRNKGLPPGPICTPSIKTLDAVLQAPRTDYLFFVAKADFSGYHHFSNNFAEHDRYAKEYQKALNQYLANKQAP